MFDGCGERQVLGFSRHNGLSFLTSTTLHTIQHMTRHPTWQGHTHTIEDSYTIFYQGW